MSYIITSLLLPALLRSISRPRISTETILVDWQALPVA